MADSVTTQQADIKKLHAEAKATFANCGLKREAEDREKLSAEANAIIANCRQKRAEREAKREDRKKLLAEANYTMADSGATQHARIQKLLDSSDAILANIQLKRDDGEELDEAEWEEAIAEAKRLQREAREKLFAISQREAERLCVSFLVASLAAKVLSE